MRPFWFFMIFPLLFFELAYQADHPLKKKYVIRQINLKCLNIDKTRIQIDRCDIKSRRGTNGLLNLVAHYEGIDDMKIETKLYYRGTSGRYQPFIVNVQFDICNFANAAASNPIVKAAFNVLAVRFDPTIVDGCPLKGPFNLTEWDPEADYDKLVFVKVLPEGTFLFNIRAFDSQNKTYIEFKNTINIRAVGMQDSIKMG